MRAIIIAAGSELIHNSKPETNSLFITQLLMQAGILVDMKIAAADDVDYLTWIIKNACKRAQLVIVTGGLGPTQDDVCREAAANALGRELIYREDMVEIIRQRFRQRGMTMPEINTRQAFIIKDAHIIDNPLGTAPGQMIIADENVKLFLLPGPPREMEPMFSQLFKDYIQPLSNYHIYQKVLKFADIGESELDQRIQAIYGKYRNPKTTILASPGVIEVRLLGRSKKDADEARLVTEELAGRIQNELNDYFVTDQDIDFAEWIVKELTRQQLTLAVAESCTGGALGHVITNVPGSSAVFLGGVIAYANSIKEKLLGVNTECLEKFGAVSHQVAEQMAVGIRQKTAADIGLSVTGIAGPGGGSHEKPVGMVFLHLAAENFNKGMYSIFPGERKLVKKRTVNTALNMIRNYLKFKAETIKKAHDTGG
jgi:nicotinamide-nucleotide amidase